MENSVFKVPKKRKLKEKKDPPAKKRKFDETAIRIKTLVSSLKNHIKTNTFKRTKHIDDMSKYINSDIDVDEDVKKLTVLATRVDLFPDFVRDWKGLNTVIPLLQHENSDIVYHVVELLVELTDPEFVSENESAIIMINTVIEMKVIEMICGLIKKISSDDHDHGNEEDGEEEEEEEEEEDMLKCIYNCLNIVNNCNEIDPETSDIVATKTKLVYWLLDYVNGYGNPKVKMLFLPLYYFSCETLSIFLATSEEVRLLFSNKILTEKLLNGIFCYANKNPHDLESTEAFENLMNCVYSINLDNNKVKEVFRECDGIQFLLKMAKENKFARVSVFKSIDCVLLSNKVNVETFVKCGGLKILFAIFMKKSKKDGNNKNLLLEHLISCFISIVRNADSIENRLYKKFKEKGYEKLHRLFEVFNIFHNSVLKFERDVKSGEFEKMLKFQGQIFLSKEELDDKIFLTRLEKGLLTAQQCSLLFCYLSHDNDINKAFLSLLSSKQSNIRKELIINYIDDYDLTMNDLDTHKWCNTLKNNIK